MLKTHKTIKQTSSFRSGIEITLNQDREIIVEQVDPASSFAADLGYEEGDVILEINGMEFNLGTIQEVVETYHETIEVGDKVKIVVRREGKNGKMKDKKLKAKAIEIDTIVKHFLELDTDPSEEQYRVLQSWIIAGK